MGQRAVTFAMREAKERIKANWRDQIRSARLGDKLANAVRGETYPKTKESMNAGALIWSNAPKLHLAHETGALIRAKSGFYLAIATPAAGGGPGGRRLTPMEWHRKNPSLELRLVKRPGKPTLLVLDDARISSKGYGKRKGGKRRRDGLLSGAQTVVMFILVPQARLRKRLNLMEQAKIISDRLPDRIAAYWSNSQ